MNETARILCAISADKPMDFGDFLKAIDQQMDAKLLALLRSLEEQGLIATEGTCSPITFIELTPLGAERAREAREDDKLPPRRPKFKSGLVIDA